MSCGGSSPAPGSGVLHISGSRLRARITNGGGDARRFDGWHDSKLDRDCSFALAEDGVFRCLPASGMIAYAPVYTDPTCSGDSLATSLGPDLTGEFLSIGGATSSPARTCGADVATLAAQTSGTITSLWRLGASQAVPPALYFRDTSGRCNPATFPDITAAYPLQHIAPTEMVGVSETRVEPRGASLAAQIFVQDDGSSMVGSTLDAESKQWCLPSWNLGVTDDYRCYSLAPGGFDNTCTPGAASGCEGDVTVGYIGFCVPPPFTRAGATTCEAADPTQMPALESDLVGTGRIRLVITHASGNKHALLVNPSLFHDNGRYRRGPFFDTQLSLPCDAAPMDDGTILCVTEDTLRADAYSDSACTHLIAEGPGDDPCTAHGTTPTPRYALGGAWDALHLYGIGAAVAPGTAYFQDTSTDPPSCTSYQLQYGGYELTSADVSVFATLTSEIE